MVRVLESWGPMCQLSRCLPGLPCLGTCRLELVPHVSYIHVFLSFTPRFGGRTNGVLIIMVCRALTLSNGLSGLRFVFKFIVVGLKLTTI